MHDNTAEHWDEITGNTKKAGLGTFKPSEDIAPDPVRGLAMRRSNMLPDINCQLPLDNRRSPGYRRIEPFMTNNQFYMWIGEHETGRYSKAHCHT